MATRKVKKSKPKFKRNLETHKLVAQKPNQFAVHHNGLNVDVLVELVATDEGKIEVNCYCDPERGLTDEEKETVGKDIKEMVSHTIPQFGTGVQ